MVVSFEDSELENECFQLWERVLPLSWILFLCDAPVLGKPELSRKGDRSFARGVPVAVPRSSSGVCASLKEPCLPRLHSVLSAQPRSELLVVRNPTKATESSFGPVRMELKFACSSQPVVCRACLKSGN